MSDCSKKPLGTQELVFVTVHRIQPTANAVTLHMEHILTGRSFEHTISRDKLKFENCYKQIEEGNNYIVVETLEAPKRWVYTSCRLVTKTQARQIFKMTGISPSNETLMAAMRWLTEQNKTKTPSIPQDLADVLIFD